MQYVDAAGIKEAVSYHASLIGIRTDPATVFGLVLMAIAALAVWWADREARNNSNNRGKELKDDTKSSPQLRPSDMSHRDETEGESDVADDVE